MLFQCIQHWWYIFYGSPSFSQQNSSSNIDFACTNSRNAQAHKKLFQCLKIRLNFQRWSPRGRPWPRGRPRGHVLKSLALASRPQVLENWPVLGSKTALFLEMLKFCGALEKFFGKRFFVEIAWKIFVKTFFLKSTCACILGSWPWPRAFLSLALRVSVLGKAVLGLGFCLCPWPWPRALCPRLHLCQFLWGTVDRRYFWKSWRYLWTKSKKPFIETLQNSPEITPTFAELFSIKYPSQIS